MYKHSLDVYGENLAVADLTNSKTESDGVFVGGTNGGLVINVIADTAVTVSGKGSVVVKASDARDGSYAEVVTIEVPAGTYARGERIATGSLPVDVKDWVKADATISGTGVVNVTPGYLAR